MVWIGKYKQGYEPVAQKFKSLSNKNKAKRRAILLKHLEANKVHKEARTKENRKYVSIIRKSLTPVQKDEVKQAVADRYKVIALIEEEEAKKKGILVSELKQQKLVLKIREKKKRLREQQILEGKAPVAAKKSSSCKTSR